jgi:ATP-dependent RNA helicase SUPV3L1/SUV3
VRFGAYHIYVPALLKPAPRVLATQLYALKHDETTGLDTIQNLAASGRTSIVADKTIAPDLYRIAGFRVCGERAVRVDILERLADLIRPALAWRPGAPGPRPAAAADKFGFVVTTAMTSLAGCSGEDFASVLRALGYRMEKRPKPPPEPAATVVETPTVEPAAGDTAPAEAATAETPSPETTPTEAPMTDPAAVDVTPLAAEVAPDVAAVEAPTEVAPDVAPAEAPTEAAPVAEPTEAPAETTTAAAPVEAAAEAPAASASEATAATAAASAEPEMIEVWRPGRPEGQRRPPRPPREARPRREPRRPRHAPPAAAAANGAPAPADGVAAASAEGAAAAEGTPAPDTRKPWRRRDRGRQDDRREDQRREPGERSARPPRPDRPPREDRPGGRPHRERGDRPPRGDRPDRDPELRAKYIKGREGRGGGRDAQPDPNSPFAKLAALKAQLESNKES